MLLLYIKVGTDKLRGRKIIWTVHNLLAHKSYHPALEKKFLKNLSSLCDGLIFLGQKSVLDFFALYGPIPQDKYTVIPHGHYRDFYGVPIDKKEARKMLDLPENKTILMFFGTIHPYKNVEKLIAAFLEMKNNDFHLLIAGECKDQSLTDKIKDLSKEHDNIHLSLQFIDNNQVSVYFTAADIVMLPYKNILNSGSALLSLSFSRPVVLPAVPTMLELQESVGKSWVYTFSDDISAKTIIDASENFDQGRVYNAVCDLEIFNWDRIAQKTLGFYQSVWEKQ